MGRRRANEIYKCFSEACASQDIWSYFRSARRFVSPHLNGSVREEGRSSGVSTLGIFPTKASDCAAPIRDGGAWTTAPTQDFFFARHVTRKHGRRRETRMSCISLNFDVLKLQPNSVTKRNRRHREHVSWMDPELNFTHIFKKVKIRRKKKRL